MNTTARLAAALSCLALAACATTGPVLMPASPPVAAMPHEVAATPENYTDQTVLWGGMILAVSNLADSTEVTVLGYPLDRAQRPTRVQDSEYVYPLVRAEHVHRWSNW
ncbi:MAG TPA: Slp family lipoprotein [Tahibacter sp.]|nr:Slp family lipoprotein [Tahibacter sp.]